MDGWICLIVYVRDRQKVVTEMDMIFGGDLIEVKVTSPIDDASSDSYCFVKCEEYASHIDDLKASSVVRAALPSYNNPQILTDDEVDGFFLSFEPKDSGDLSCGDLVCVVDGYLSGLFGLVVEKGKHGKWRILFRFYIRKFIEELYSRQVKVVDNAFRQLKNPVVAATFPRRGKRMKGKQKSKTRGAKRRGLDKVCRSKG